VNSFFLQLFRYWTRHTRHTAKSNARWRMSADRAVLALHILVGLLETFRFALLDLFRPPVADLLDVALCLVQSLTNVALVRRITRGLAYITRTSLLSPIPARSYLSRVISSFTISPGDT
jgi:hypothetical protein